MVRLFNIGYYVTNVKMINYFFALNAHKYILIYNNYFRLTKNNAKTNKKWNIIKNLHKNYF